MVSREHNKAAALHDNLHLLRSITNSHAVNETSIIVDASKYIEKLKERVKRLNQDMAQASSSSQNLYPAVKVERLEKGFVVNVSSEKSCPGLLVSILEVFEDLGLNVLEARVSCADNFWLQAVGREEDEKCDQNVDAQVVKQAVLRAIGNWSATENNDHHHHHLG